MGSYIPTDGERITELEGVVENLIGTIELLVDAVEVLNKRINGHGVRITDNRTSIGPDLEQV